MTSQRATPAEHAPIDPAEKQWSKVQKIQNKRKREEASEAAQAHRSQVSSQHPPRSKPQPERAPAKRTRER